MTIRWTKRLNASARTRPEYAAPEYRARNRVAARASPAPSGAMDESTPWRALGTIGARNMTSMPNAHSTSSGAIRYKSWRGGNIYLGFTKLAALPDGVESAPFAGMAE